LFAKLGHKVMRLARVAIGEVKLRKLAVGQARPASHDELKLLRSAAYSMPDQKRRLKLNPTKARRRGKPDPKLAPQPRRPRPDGRRRLGDGTNSRSPRTGGGRRPGSGSSGGRSQGPRSSASRRPGSRLGGSMGRLSRRGRPG
jgi:23S rRNA pseudouridine2605 synthase